MQSRLLPAGISSFVCRRVYDIDNKCLWWLTDKDYISERQEEINRLLLRTRLEMHAVVQLGGLSPKRLKGALVAQQKSSSDGTQNCGPSKGKKRDRADQGNDPAKRDCARPVKVDESEPGSLKVENMKSEIAKITEKDGLLHAEAVEKLVHLMQLDRTERKIDFAGRVMLANIIAATESPNCLVRFDQLRGLAVLCNWLEEVHNGKCAEGSSPKETAEEIIFALLCALAKLPINLNALQSCSIGKFVNQLRSHKNMEIQKKANCLVLNWKKRVDAEMKSNDVKSNSRVVELNTSEASRREIVAEVKEATEYSALRKIVDWLRVERTRAVAVETTRETTSAVVRVAAESTSSHRRVNRTIKCWHKVQHLGSGSFGSVYEAINYDGFFFAIKEVSLMDQGLNAKQCIEQLEHEITLLSRLEHENIVQYFGTDKRDGKLCIFLELVTQGSLAVLYQKCRLQDSQVSAYTRQILNGLHYLHQQNVLHRDIKCANILVDARGLVKLADFGLAKQVSSQINSCKGTIYWMAPEVAKSQPQGPSADIWSLGCTVLEMLTGKVPYPDMEWPRALYKIGKGIPPEIPSTLSEDARDFIKSCVQKDPNDRPSAAQLLKHPFVQRPVHH